MEVEMHPAGPASASGEPIDEARDAPAPARAGSKGDGGVPLRESLRPRGPVHFDVSERREDEDDDTIVHVGGELDVLTAPKLAARLDEIGRRPGGEVVVDLCDVEFIDSAGLHVLLNAQRRLTRRARRFAVVCGPGPVRRIIELARLVETLGLRSTRVDERPAA